MSLLMDALKRAPPPAQPSSSGVGAAGTTPPLSLEPLPTPPTGLPDLANHIEAVNADLAATARQAAAPPAAPAAADAIQAQARDAFLARDPPPTSSAPTRPYWLAAAGLLAALGLGAYFWWQLQALAPRPLTTLAPTAARPAPPAAPQASPPLPAPTRPAPAQADIQRAMTGNRLTYDTPRPPPLPTAETGPALRIQRTPPPLDPELQAGHRALEQKSLREARQDFEQVLKRDPHNLDALLGLAAIAQNEGRGPVALQLYQAALAAHPKDARALAGYLGLSGGRDPEMTESRLKTLLAEQPDAAPLHFSLGNLLANAGRWHEAQQAYFNAHALDSGNPDYLFNLAVSLDRLNQPRLAADHYRRALDAARRRPAVFDPAVLNQRLQALEGATP